MLRGLAAIHAIANGLDLRTGQPYGRQAPPSPPQPTAAAPITAERAEEIGAAFRAAAEKERTNEAHTGLGSAMQRHLAKVLPAAAVEANALDLELRVAPGDGAQLRLAKVCAREVMRLCGAQKAAPAIDYARAVASGTGSAFVRADHRSAAPRGVLGAVRRR
jgi:hypothetical protein